MAKDKRGEKTLDLRELVNVLLPSEMENTLDEAGYEIDDCKIRFRHEATKQEIADHVAELIKPLIKKAIKNG